MLFLAVATTWSLVGTERASPAEDTGTMLFPSILLPSPLLSSTLLTALGEDRERGARDEATAQQLLSRTKVLK